jgi:hypothetical protein
LITAPPRLEGEAIPGVGGVGAPGMPEMPVNEGAAAAAFRHRYGLEPGGRPMAPAPPPAEMAPAPPPDAGAPGATPGTEVAGAVTNQLGILTITFRAVSLKNASGQPDADKGIAYTVLQELQTSPYFDPDPQNTHTTSEVMNDEQTGTFTFSIAAKLKHPLKL